MTQSLFTQEESSQPYLAIPSGHVLVIVLQDVAQLLLLQKLGKVVSVLEHSLALLSNRFLFFCFNLLWRTVRLIFCLPLPDVVFRGKFSTLDKTVTEWRVIILSCYHYFH